MPRKKRMFITKEDFVKNFIFGVEDSLVSTGGLLAGVAVADVPNKTIILTGLVLIFVEAFSMGVGSYLSEQTAEQYATGRDIAANKDIPGAAVMFISYFFAGFFPLAPYAFMDMPMSFYSSVMVSLVFLFLLGAISAKFYEHRDFVRHGLQMLIVGGLAVLVGSLVGSLVNAA